MAGILGSILRSSIDPKVIDQDTGIPVGLSFDQENNQYTDAAGNVWRANQDPNDPSTPTSWQNITESSKGALDSTGIWARDIGLQDPGGFAARVSSGSLTPHDLAAMSKISSVAPQYSGGKLTNGQDIWNDTITRAQDRQTPGDMFGINGLGNIDDNYFGMFLASALGGAYAGAGAGAGEAGSAGNLAAADAAGGLMPEYGTTAAYNAGLGSGATGATAVTTTPTLSGGDPMWDWLDNIGLDGSGNSNGLFEGGSGDSFDPMSGDPSTLMPPAVPETDPTFGGELDPTGDGQWTDLSKFGLGGPGSVLQRIVGAGSGLLKTAVGGNGLTLGGAAFNSTPFLLSAALANKQNNDINPYLDRLNTLSDRFAGNESPYLKSLTDPYDMATAKGRGDLTMRLGDRGVLGSSFGAMDLDNFGYMRDVGRGNLVSQAINQSVGAQSQLTDQAIKGINTRNAGTNALLGAGLNASARLFSPQKDPFGIASLLRGN